MVDWIAPDDAACSRMVAIRGRDGGRGVAAILDEPLDRVRLDAAKEVGFRPVFLPELGVSALLSYGDELDLEKVRAVFPNATLADVNPSAILQTVDALPAPGRDDVVLAQEPVDEPASIGERVNHFQNRYVPRSRCASGSAMIPTNMASAVAEAVRRVEGRHGDIDRFVADRLDFDFDQLNACLGAEQVDAIALALDTNEAERAFLLADQTGQGKGRVLAALAMAARLRGQTVIFFTERANLFSDFWRDLTDIGGDKVFNRPFILNTDGRVLDPETQTEAFTSDRKSVIDGHVRDGTLPEGADLVLTTYSQISGPKSKKAEWIKAIADGAFLEADESHNAAGSSNTARVMSDVASRVTGAVFSSATFAGRPESMSAYAPVFPKGFMSTKQLSETVKAGGRPLQEALSQTLSADGVLIRREHDLSNIEIEVKDDTGRRDRNQRYVDALAPILREMADMALKIEDVVEEKNQENRRKIADLSKAEQKRQKITWSTANFGSRLAAIVRQFVSGLKVDLAVDECIESLRQGQKPVVVVEATMESLMRELAGGEIARAGYDANPDLFQASGGDDDRGDDHQRPPDFRDALRLMLDRMMRLSIRYGTGDKDEEVVDDPELQSRAQALHQTIADFPDLSMNLIDDVRDRIEAAGYSASEISARSVRVRDGRYEAMPAGDRNDTIAAFNNGDVDALVLTGAGATGLSLHASHRVQDVRPRRMIELQIPSNVIERIQFWGRVHRKGQLVEPSFCSLSTGLPFEMRLLAMQNKKAEALSANVSASSDSAAAMSVPDLLDETGNDVCKRLLEESPWVAEVMGISLNVDESQASQDLYYVNKVLQRMILLPSEQQDKVYQGIVTAYEDQMREVEARTGARGRVRELDGAWVREHVEIYDNGPDLPDSVFGEPIYLTTLKTTRYTEPMRSSDVSEAIRLALQRMRDDTEAGGAPLRDRAARVRNGERKLLERALPRHFGSVDKAMASRNNNPVKWQHDKFQTMCQLLEMLQPGWWLEMPDDQTSEYHAGVIVDVRYPPTSQAHLPGRYGIRYVVPGDEKPREVSLAAILRRRYDKHPIRLAEPGRSETYTQFDRPEGGQVTVRRQVLEGNLFMAVDIGQRYGFGNTIVYRDETGSQRRGLLLPQSRENVLDRVPNTVDTPEMALSLLAADRGPIFNRLKKTRRLDLDNEGGQLKLSTDLNSEMIDRYFPKVVRQHCRWVGKQNFSFVGYADPRAVKPIMKYFQEQGYTFYCDGKHRSAVAKMRAETRNTPAAKGSRSGPRDGSLTSRQPDAEPVEAAGLTA